MTFNELHLIEPLLKALEKEGYQTPTPIQQKAIPPVLQRRDLLGCAQTGTGKTAAFTLPVLQLMQEDQAATAGKAQGIRTLILTPTRELAIQISESIRNYGRFLRLRHHVIFGGVSQHAQVQILQRGIDILVATPGRLLDLMQQGYVDLRQVRYFILDEADRMLDMGFIHDVKRIIAKLPAQRQTLFFSATMPPEIQKLAGVLLKDPVKVEVTPVSSTVDTIQQTVFHVNRQDKVGHLLHLLSDGSVKTMLVFTQMKHAANKLANRLNANGIPADAIHGNKSQQARQTALENFKKRQIRVLVATDIAARGIDIDDLTHVLNYELPNVPETYVHRIGRTGRAGAGGTALSFCDHQEREFLASIEKLIRKKIPVGSLPPVSLLALAAPEVRTSERAPRSTGGRSNGQLRNTRQTGKLRLESPGSPTGRSSKKPAPSRGPKPVVTNKVAQQTSPVNKELKAAPSPARSPHSASQSAGPKPWDPATSSETINLDDLKW
jgi:ATP-dependent RNA helicase RhlE